jgi:hypothetical protein
MRGADLDRTRPPGAGSHDLFEDGLRNEDATIERA